MDWFVISEDLKKFICNGFELIKNSPDLTEKQKFQLIDRLLSMGAGAGWRPKAISINALKLFVKNDFKKPKGLERAHVYHRRHTLSELLKTKWENDEWWDWYKERDYTILSTREENRKEKDRGDEAGDQVARDLPGTRQFHYSLTRKMLMNADEAMITTISVNSAIVEA